MITLKNNINLSYSYGIYLALMMIITVASVVSGN